MGSELRRVHALNGSDAVGIVARAVRVNAVFKDIGAPWQRVEIEVGGSILRSPVVKDAVLPTDAGDLIHRFETGGAGILQMHEF